MTAEALERLLGPSLHEAKQYAGAYIGAPTNHDLERSLRFAALLACLHLILEQNRLEEAEAAMERGKPRDTFCEPARKWVHGQLFALGEVQGGAHRESVATYQATLNTALASQPDLRDAARAAEDRKTAETNMWQELVDALPNQQFPTDFEARFKREDGDGWFGCFINFLREALKNHDNARHAFFIGGLSDLQNAVTRIESMLKDVPTAEKNAMAVVDEFVRRGLAAPARSSGFLDITVISLAKQLNPKLGYDMDLALRELQNAVDIAVALRTFNERSSSNVVESASLKLVVWDQVSPTKMTQRSPSHFRLSDLQAVSYAKDPFVTSILAEVVRRNDEGRLDAGASAVDLGLAKIEEYAVTEEENLSYKVAVFLDDRALPETDYTQRKVGLNVETVRTTWTQALVAKLGGLGVLIAPFTWHWHGIRSLETVIEKKASAVVERAESLAAKLDALGRAITPEDSWLSDRIMLDVAAIKQDLLNRDTASLVKRAESLSTQLDTIDEIQSRYAKRARSISLLKIGINQDLLRRNVQAVVDRVEKLVALDGPRRPAWAPDFLEYQYEFYQQGRDKGINLPLEVAIAMAQRMRATAKTDDERGTALKLLGTALQTLGMREGGTARLEEAVTAYREALEERTRDRVPRDWAYSQHNLAECLATLAERSPTPGPILADAITHMQNAADGHRQVGDEYWGPIAEKRLAELKALAQMPRG